MKKRGNGRAIGRRLLGIALAMLLTGSTFIEPVAAAAAETWIPAPLEASRLENPPEGNVVYFGTASVTLDEANAAYSVPVYREGDLSGAATVEVRTMDLSATYGRDYTLLMPETEKTGSGRTLLETYLGDLDSYEAALNAEDAEFYLVGDISGEESEESAESYTEVPGTGTAASGKSALAALKEAQTGEETRTLYETEYDELLDAAVQQLVPQLMEQLDYSSTTTLSFAPGESEKTLTFRIRDDHASEGTETFTILLAGAEGAEPYEVTTLSVAIRDDEPAVRSQVSFTKSRYVAADGEARVVLRRSGAEYSLVDLRLSCSDGTAVSGENYEDISELVSFAPYETEKELTIPVCGEGSFTLLLTELTACEAGRYTEAAVEILPTEESGEEGRARVLAASSGTSSFTIQLDKSYTVEYTTGESTGKIMDTDYSPAVQVGTYYFSMPVSTGIFHYGTGSANFSGDEPSWLGVWNCDYQSKSPQHESYGRIEYCSPTAWDEGAVTAYSDAVIPAAYYQYMTPDWKAPSDSGNNMRFYFKIPTLGLTQKLDRNSGFSRTATNAVIRLLDGSSKPYNKNVRVDVVAADETGNCPKSYIHFYGVACLYQRYRVNISLPNQLSYRTGTGATVSAAPVDFQVECGAQTFLPGDTQRDIYANTDSSATNLVFSLKPTTVNGATGKFGTLSGYTIVIDPGDSAKQTTLKYPADFESYLRSSIGTTGCVADYSESAVNARIRKLHDQETTLAVVPYDIYFMDWIASAQKGVVSSGYGYYQNLTFTPEFQYIDCAVRVMEPADGLSASFSEEELKAGETYVFHGGDVLDLSAVTEDYAYTVVGYSVSRDGGVHWNDITDTDKLKLVPGEDYCIRPLLSARDNCIELRYGTEAQGFTVYGVDYLGTVPQSTLSTLGLGGRTILKVKNALSAAEQVVPVVGKTYTICIAPDTTTRTGQTLYPVLTDAYGETYDGTCFHYTARQKRADNVLTLSYVAAASEPEACTVTGRLVSEYEPILSTGTATPRLGVEDYLVSMGTNEVTSGGQIGTATAVTDDGYFTLSGVRLYAAAGGGQATLLVYHGAGEQVVTVPFDPAALGADRVLDVGEICLDYPHDAPRVASLSYSYDKDASNLQKDSTSNSVSILNDNLNITIVVEDNGCNVTGAVFTRRTTGGLKESTVVEAGASKGVFTYTIKGMNTCLFNGDRIYISLVTEDETGEHRTPEVDSGLVFFTENTLVVPQTFETESTDSITVPFLGAVDAKSSSGLLSFSRTNWDGGTGYTLTVNVDAMFVNRGTPSTKEKLALYNSLTSKAKDAQTYKQAAEDIKTPTEDLKNSASALFSQVESGSSGWDETELMEYWDITEQISSNESLLDAVNQSGKEAKDAVSQFGKNKILQADILFLLAFDFYLDQESNQYVFCSGSASAGGSFSFNKSFYYVVYGAPVFLNLSGFIQSDFTLYYKTEEGQAALTAGAFESYAGNIAQKLSGDSLYSTLGVGIKVGAGLGMCNMLDIGGAANFQFNGRVPVGGVGSWGVLLIGTGSLFFDMLMLRVEVPLVTGTLGYGSYAGRTDVSFLGAFDALLNNAAPGGAEAASQTVSLREHDAGTADLSGFGGNGLIRATPEEVQRTTLLNNASDRTAPQLLSLGGGRKLLVFIANRGGDDAVSSRALFWSLYENGAWSAPQLLADDGTFDASPTLLQKNGRVVAAWVDADGSAAGDSSAVEKLNSLGISMAVFENGTWSEEITLVEDGFFNFAPQLALVGDTLYCSYMKRDISGVTDAAGLLDYTATYSTMAYVACDVRTGTVIPGDSGDRETYISIRHPRLKDPLVLDYQCAAMTVGGESYLLASYTVDEDENLSTGGDRELFLAITDLTTGREYYPIQLTDSSVSESDPRLTELDGTVYLTWLEEGSLLRLLDVSALVTAFFHPETVDTAENVYSGVGSVYRSATDEDWYRQSAAALGLDESSYAGTGYEDACRGIFRTEQVELGGDGAQTAISEYALVSNGEDIYLFYTDFDSIDPEDYSEELFGVPYRRGGADQSRGFGKAVQITDFGRVIDEFSIIMNEKNEISVVSNYYRQWIDSATGLSAQSANQLVEIDFQPVGSVAVAENGLRLPESLVCGTCETVDLTVVNNGLLPAEGFDVTLTEVADGAEKTVYTGHFALELGSGESCTVELPWTIPASLAGRSLRAAVSETGVSAARPDSFTKEIPCRSALRFADTEAKWDDSGSYVTAVIRNQGGAASEAGTVRVSADGDSGRVFGSCALPALAPGAELTLTIPIAPGVADYDRTGMVELKLEALADGATLASAFTRLIPGRPAVAELNGGAAALTLAVGETERLTAAVGPWAGLAGEARFASSDPAVAAVGQDGTLRACRSGSAVITVYYPCGVSAAMEVTVSGGSSAPVVTPDRPNASSGTAVDTTGNGSVTVSPDAPAQGDTVTVTPRPDPGYAVGSVTVTDGSGQPITVKDNGDGTYSFRQGTGQATVHVSFIRTGLAFTDVSTANVHYDAIAWAVENGITSGRTATTFDPNGTCTRAQAVTFLWRAAGSPEPALTRNPFTDVKEGSAFYKAILWAVENGITEGRTATTFDPSGSCTRAHIITFMYRAAKAAGEDVSAGGDTDILRYTDAQEIGAYAREAMQWGCGAGIINGYADGSLRPNAACTRAHIVSFLYRSAK